MRVIVCFLALLWGAAAANAQAYDSARWSLSSEGRAAGICNLSGQYYSCFAVTCADGGPLSFEFTYNVGSYAARPNARFAAGKYRNVLPFVASGTGRMSRDVDPARDAAALQGLRDGRTLEFSPGFDHSFGLRGSGRAIQSVLATCAAEPKAPVRSAALGTPPDGDEAALVWPQGTSHWQLLFNTDLPGNDLTSGFEDPTLKNVEEATCRRRCLDLGQCAGYTFFRKTCILKSAIGRSKAFQGARSAVLKERITPRPAPRLPGPDVRLVTSLPAEDSIQAHVAAIRKRAQRYGDSCDIERAELQALAQTFSAQPASELSQAKAGTALQINWQGNTLTRALPVWFMVTSDAPVRFSGIGSYGLGPGSVGPFGLKTDAARTRGITALYARGAGQEGQIDVTPLQAGPQQLDLVLVGYLRACNEVVELSRDTIALDVAPSRSELVLNDEFDVSNWMHEIRIPELNRIVRLDGQRVLVLDSRDMSEVALHAGSKPSLSPSKRFLALLDPSIVIDLVDGALVAELSKPFGTEVAWMNADSYVLTDSTPWGDIDLKSLFHDGVNVHDQNTGPACCDARNIGTVVQVDLENNVVIVSGTLGHHVTALQNRNVKDFENAGSGYALDGKVAPGAILTAAKMMSPVTDVAFAPSWDRALGPVFTQRAGAAQTSISEPFWPDYITELDAQQLSVGASVVGQTVKFRGLAPYLWQATETETTALQKDLARVGLRLAPFVEATEEWNPAGIGRGAFKDVAFDPPYVAQRSKISKSLASHGFQLNWDLPKPDDAVWDCVDFSAGTPLVLRDGQNTPNLFTSRFDAVHHLALGPRDIWIMRALCSAGATFGSLRQESFTAVFDSTQLAQRPSADMVIDETLYMGNSGIDAFAANPMTWRLFADRYLLGFTQTGGRIKMFDLQDWSMILRKTELTDGALMVDAALTEDLGHLVQINNDGSFLVYRIADFAPVLNGRVADKEVGVWTPDYQFDATAEAASYISLRFPGLPGDHALEQFDAQLRVPGLVNKVLTDAVLPPRPDLALPPQLAGTLTAQDQQIALTYSLTSDPSDVKLQVYQDGLLTDTLPVSDAKGTARVARLGSTRWASVVAVDGDGLVSLPIGADLGKALTPSGLRVLAVGVDEYDDPNLPPLGFAASDAALAARALSALAESATSEPVVLSNRAASAEAVLNNTRNLVSDMGPEDHAVLFFAGHGVLDDDGAFRLALSETQMTNINDTALRFEDLREIVAQAKGRVTILLDACHSGASGTGALATNDDVLEGRAVTLPPNLLILSASRGREVSLESAGLGAGVFTSALSEVLSDPVPHDLNANGNLELSEFYRSVRTLVAGRTNGAQNPWIARNRSIGDFSMF